MCEKAFLWPRYSKPFALKNKLFHVLNWHAMYFMFVSYEWIKIIYSIYLLYFWVEWLIILIRKETYMCKAKNCIHNSLLVLPKYEKTCKTNFFRYIFCQKHLAQESYLIKCRNWIFFYFWKYFLKYNKPVSYFC